MSELKERMDGLKKLFKLKDEEKSILKPLVEEESIKKQKINHIKKKFKILKMNSTLAKII